MSKTVECPFCEQQVDEAESYCEECEGVCCEGCHIYVETYAATWIDPSDGVYLCPNCVGSPSDGQEEYELRRAEDRADERSLRQVEIDNALW